MSSTATLEASQAILKILYPPGVERAINDRYKFFKDIAKKGGFGGDSAVVAIEHELPQGLGVDVATAQEALYQVQLDKFTLNRKNRFSLCRITGEALEAATTKSGGALKDLWKLQTKGSEDALMMDHAFEVYGDGTGVRGQILSGQATTSVTLTEGTNMNYFHQNMLLQAVSDTTTSPTVRGGTARVTGIDRKNRVLKFASALSAQIAGVTAGDSLVRKGDAAVAGVVKLMTGTKAYIAGGTSPGTLFSLNRDSDPVRLAGQTEDGTGQECDVVLADAYAELENQGFAGKRVAYVHPTKYQKMKNSLSSKIIYDRGAGSGDAGTSFGSVKVATNDGVIDVKPDPWSPLTEALITDLGSIDLYHLNGVCQILDMDSNQFLRLSTDDSYEMRFATRGQYRVTRPGNFVRITGFGE